MATLPTLAVRGDLVKMTIPLGPNDGLPMRQLYLTLEVRDWINGTLPRLATEHGATRSPVEEFDDLLFQYISSKGRLRYNQGGRVKFRDLMPATDETWELITYQLRICGWFYRKDQFVAVHPDTAVNIKRNEGGYRNAKRKVIEVRDRLDLDEPRFVGGVISNVITI
jgi:hypothetical protein